MATLPVFQTSVKRQVVLSNHIKVETVYVNISEVSNEEVVCVLLCCTPNKNTHTTVWRLNFDS